MKKLSLWRVLAFLLLGALTQAAMAKADDATAFSQAIAALQAIDDPESVNTACELLADIPGSYNQADVFQRYAEMIRGIYNDDLDDVVNTIYVLDSIQGFEDRLREYRLPDCDTIGRYVDARRMEDNGLYSEAYDIYSGIVFMDSMDRMTNLVGYSKQEQAYQSAMQLFYARNYAEAAQAFEALGDYKNSPSKAEESRNKQHYELNLPWPRANWDDRTDGCILAMVDQRFSDADMEKLAKGLRNAFDIPCVMVRTEASEAVDRFDAMYDADLVGVVVCGESWVDYADLVDRCTAKELPVWCSEQTKANDLLAELTRLWIKDTVSQLTSSHES